MARLPRFALVACATAVASGCSSAAWGPDQCVFAPHMVLASSDAWRSGVTPARVWGNAAPGEVLTLSGLPDGAVVTPSNPWKAAADGTWTIQIEALASLTPSNLTFSGSSKMSTTLTDILFGHTFLCSGQSNMDMNVGCTFTVNETNVDRLKYPEIRLMNQGANGYWASAADPSSPAFLDEFSATCYYTAFNAKEFVPAFKNVPIGLVRSSVGGQCIERFESSASLEAVGIPALNATTESCGQNSTTLYETLILPLAPFVFKTMIWYQGEANVGCNFQTQPAWMYHYYERLLPELISSWRELFAVNFTALVVQLAAYGAVDPLPAQRTLDALPELRDTQYSALTLPGTGVSLAIDIGDDGHTIWTPPSCGFHGGIHPRNKTEVGRRLALRLAELEGVLPDGLFPDGPIISSMKAQPTGALLTFSGPSSAGMGLAPTADCVTVGELPSPYNASNAACCQTAVKGSPEWGWPFELLLADNSTYVIAKAAVAGSSVTLTPFNASQPGPFLGIRYAWQGFPLCVLSNAQGMPTGPFAAALGQA